MEPLDALVQRISGRPRRRPQYEPVEFEEVDGSMRRLPPGIAGADDAQSFDISSAIAPSQPIFARGEEDDGPETPVQLASSEQKKPNPFRLASMGAEPQYTQTSGATRYQKVCTPDGCRMVPIMDGPSQATISQQLPPGVEVGPGETFVQGSLREVTRPPAAAQRMAAPQQQTAPQPSRPAATGQPQAPQQVNAMQVLSSLAEEIQRDAERYNADADRYYAEADANKANRDAIGFMQNDERGDVSRQAGINATQLYYMTKTALANQANLDQQFDLQKKKARSRTLEGRLEEEASVISARGKSIPVRTQQLFEIRTGVAAAQQRPMDEAEATRMRDMIEGEIYATDSSSYYLDYRNALNQWKASGGRDDAALQNAYALRAEAFGTMLRRFGNAEDRADLERRMRAELTPIFRARYDDYYKENPRMLPAGVTGSAATLQANADALRAVSTSIALVADYLEGGKSPYEAESLAPERQQQSAQQRSVSPRFDTQMVE